MAGRFWGARTACSGHRGVHNNASPTAPPAREVPCGTTTRGVARTLFNNMSEWAERADGRARLRMRSLGGLPLGATLMCSGSRGGGVWGSAWFESGGRYFDDEAAIGAGSRGGIREEVDRPREPPKRFRALAGSLMGLVCQNRDYSHGGDSPM